MFTGLGFLFLIGLGFAILAIWIWTLLDIIRSESMNPTQKLTWILAVIFFPFLGTLLYVVIGRKR